MAVKVGVGEGGWATVEEPDSMRVEERSRFAGRFLRFVERDIGGVFDGNTMDGWLEEAAAIELVRSSRAWLPEAPAATISIASSSLEARLPHSALTSRSKPGVAR
jgi:hypothetical protein